MSALEGLELTAAVIALALYALPFICMLISTVRLCSINKQLKFLYNQLAEMQRERNSPPISRRVSEPPRARQPLHLPTPADRGR